MKRFYTNIKKITGLATLSVLAVVGLVSCDITGLTDTLDEFGVVVELEPINTTATVLLYDAVTGELIDKNVTITFSGNNGGDVIDSYSDPISSSTVSDGILGFGINNAVTPSESNPASIRLIAEASGYITKVRTISLSSTGQNDFQIEMTAENNKPQGVKTASNTQGQADATTGAVSEDFTIEATAAEDDTTASGVSVNIESGTVLKDAQGNALSGQLTSSVTYYDPSSPAALDAVPFDLTDEEGNEVPILGAAAVEIRDANGRKASSASPSAAKAKSEHGLEYSFSISDSDGYLAEFLEDYNVLKVVYYDNDFNRFVADGTVTSVGSRYSVTYSASAVPVFAFVDISVIAVNGTVNYNVVRNGNNGKLALISNMNYYGIGLTSSTTIPAGTSSGSMNILNLDGADTEFIVRNATRVLASVSTTNPFSEFTLNLEAPPSNLIDAQIDVTLACSNGGEISTTDLPATSVLYRKVGAPAGTKWQTANDIQFETNSKGTALDGAVFNTTDVEQGEEYRFNVNFDGDSYYENIVISGTTVEHIYTIDNDEVCTVK